jgi:hypothetical protein
MPRDYTVMHNTYFNDQGLLRVECGGDGNCFYHVCLFLVKMFLPDKYGIGMSHRDLRNATVNNLQTHHHGIMTAHGPVTILLEGAGDCSDDEALNTIVASYCEKNRQLNEYVEDPCVHSFAHLMDIQINVYHTGLPLINSYNANASGGILTLWCDGNHYLVTLPKP